MRRRDLPDDIHYAERRRWKCEMISLNENGIGGFKEVVFMISGQGAYSRLKNESRLHRVQRVPGQKAAVGSILQPLPLPSCLKQKR